jgi:hypothetical protein
MPPVATVSRLLPVSHISFTIVAITDAAMFSAIVYVVSKSAAAPSKFGTIVVAAINLVLFHKGIYRTVGERDAGVGAPMVAKVAAVISIVSWIGVNFGGRFLSH